MTFTLPLPKKVDADLAADVEKQAPYASPHVRKLKVAADRASIEVEIEPGADEREVRGKVERYLATMVTKYRALDRKELYRHERRDREPYATSVYEELKRRGWAIELGRGQVALTGPALACYRAVDEMAAALGHQRFGAHDEIYPNLIPSAVLRRCGYFTSFPHTLSMVTHLVEDFDLIEEFRQANAQAAELTVPRREALVTPEACLAPAVCYHCYQGLEGRTLPESGHVVTSVGRCFRYESKNITGLDRLWDFTMREIIFVGTETFVNERRMAAIESAKSQMELWDLDCVIEGANDPFFSAAYATKTYYQVRSDLKYELRLGVEPGPGGAERSIACCSFNLHENFFGKTFTITAADGQPAFTGCAGWGIERWVLAAFTQHGFTPSRWPEAVRHKVFGA